MKQLISLRVNGKEYNVFTEPWLTLQEVLHDELQLTGTKRGCLEGECGACTVLIEGKPVKSCLILAPQAQRKDIVTIEGLQGESGLHPLQQAFIENFSVGCGYCTPGMILTAKELLDRNPNASQEDILKALSGNLCRCTGYFGILDAIMAVRDGLQSKSTISTIRTPHAVGVSIPRQDAREKVTGRTKYCPDIQIPGMLYAKILRSPHTHAKIIKIDISPAEKLPGVRAIVTGKDAPDIKFGLHIRDRSLLAKDGFVRFAGEPVAFVAADTEQIAEQALALIHVDYEVLPSMLDPEEALRPNPSVVIHPGLFKYEDGLRPRMCIDQNLPNAFVHYKLRHGDVENGFREAEVILENRYTSERTNHGMLEPHTYLAVHEANDDITVFATCTTAHTLKLFICEALGLPTSKVRLIVPPMGGSFGAKHWNEEYVVPTIMLALKANRPVRLALTRKDVFLDCASREHMIIYVKDGVNKDGRILARELKIIQNAGAYSRHIQTAVLTSVGNLAGIYNVPNCSADIYGVATNSQPLPSIIGFSNLQMSWAIESQMDAIAKRLGIDPLEIRKRNMLSEGDINIVGMPAKPEGAKECLHNVAQRIEEWDKQSVKDDGPWKRGMGLGIGCKFTGPTPHVSSASVKVFEDGSIELRHSAVEHGMGSHTTLAQIAADNMGIPVDKVKTAPLDTSLLAFDSGTFSSRTTAHVGQAILVASEDAKNQLRKLASSKLEVAPEDIDVAGGKISVKGVPSKAMEIRNLFASTGYAPGSSSGEIVGHGVYEGHKFIMDEETGQGEYLEPSPGICAAAAEVAVNTQTGEVKINRVASCGDPGLPINPKGCLSQLEMGIAWSIGQALYERIVEQDGIIVTRNFHDYKIPYANEMPSRENVEVMLAKVPSEGPYGAKGFAEATVAPVAAAIANAIYDAVGVRLTNLPFNREGLLEQIRTQFNARPA